MSFVVVGESVRFGLRLETDAHGDSIKMEENKDFTTASSTSNKSSSSGLEDKESLVVKVVKEVEGSVYTIENSPHEDWKLKLV